MNAKPRYIRNSLVIKLFMYIAIIMLVLFVLDNLVMLELSSKSLNEQGQRQIQIQKKHQQEQIREAEAQLLKNLDMQLNLLARLVRGPLVSRAAETEFESGETQLVNQLQPCFQLSSDEKIAQCLKYRTHRLTGAAVASVKKGLIVGAIQALLNDTDLIGIFIEDWEGILYSGFWKNEDNVLMPLTSLDNLPQNLQRLEKEVQVDWEYWGKIVFFFSTQRIEEMRRSAKAEIQEAIKLIEQNIARQRKQLLTKRLAEGVLLFILLLGAIFLASFMIILRPLKQLKQNAYQLARGDLSCPIETKRSDELGELASSFVHMRDAIREQINRLESVNQNLQQKEERLSAFIRALPDAIYVFNQQGECEEVLVPGENVLFRCLENEITKTAEDSFCYALPAGFIGGIHQTLKTGQPQLSEFALDLNEKKRWFEGRLSPMRNMKGVTELVICLIRDITPQKEAEALNKARIEAQAANEAKSVFLATMSHEIRTPMNAILGMADLLWESQLTSEQKKYVNIFRNAGENLLSIINDILDLSKIESGHLSLNKKPFNIVDIIERVCENLSIQAHEQNIELIYSIDARVPGDLVGDRLRLRQVLFNLIGNAIKFTSSGEIEVSVAPCQQDTDVLPSTGVPGKPGETALLFSVRDTGCGIAEELQEKIFDRFTQAEPYNTRRFGGTGLGLTICKHLVNMMGGRIWVDRTSGQGTTLSFTACFGAVPLDSADGLLPGVSELYEKAENPFLRPPRVLLFEDNINNQMLFIYYLKAFCHPIDVAENGQEGVEKFKNAEYDVVFMDLAMPVMDGYEATRSIRRWESEQTRSPIPVIALTADALIGREQKSIDAGCTAHITKPFTRKQILNALIATLPPEMLKSGDSAYEVPCIEMIDADLSKLIPSFFYNTQEDINTLKEALEKKDWPTLERIGHSIKGSSFGYGFKQMGQIGRLIEKAAASKENINEMDRLINRLIDYTRNVQIKYVDRHS